MKNNPENSIWVLGIDIGGSHISLGLIDMDSRNLVDDYILRKQVDSHGTAEEILTVWCDIIKSVWKNNQLENTAIGFAMPGPFDYINGVCLIKGVDKYESLYGMNIREELARRLKISGDTIRFRNDAEAFLEGEIFCGAAKGYQDVIGITLGTGMGSAASHNGITTDAELWATQYKGEIIEASVSTRGLIREYQKYTGITLKDAKALAELYDTDDEAVRVFKHFAIDFAWILNIFIQKENPEIIVIGGNITHAWDLFMEDVKKYLSYLYPQLPIIVKAKMGENAALIGGACYFLPHSPIPSNSSN